MTRSLVLSVITPERVLFEGPITYLSVPGTAGYMGVLVDHAPLISSLKPGSFEVRPQGSAEPVFFSTQKPGLLEIVSNHISVLLDAADSNALAALEKTV